MWNESVSLVQSLNRTCWRKEMEGGKGTNVWVRRSKSSLMVNCSRSCPECDWGTGIKLMLVSSLSLSHSVSPLFSVTSQYSRNFSLSFLYSSKIRVQMMHRLTAATDKSERVDGKVESEFGLWGMKEGQELHQRIGRWIQAYNNRKLNDQVGVFQTCDWLNPGWDHRKV